MEIKNNFKSRLTTVLWFRDSVYYKSDFFFHQIRISSTIVSSIPLAIRRITRRNIVWQRISWPLCNKFSKLNLMHLTTKLLYSSERILYFQWNKLIYWALQSGFYNFFCNLLYTLQILIICIWVMQDFSEYPKIPN